MKLKNETKQVLYSRDILIKQLDVSGRLTEAKIKKRKNFKNF